MLLSTHGFSMGYIVYIHTWPGSSFVPSCNASYFEASNYCLLSCNLADHATNALYQSSQLLMLCTFISDMEQSHCGTDSMRSIRFVQWVSSILQKSSVVRRCCCSIPHHSLYSSESRSSVSESLSLSLGKA